MQSKQLICLMAAGVLTLGSFGAFAASDVYHHDEDYISGMPCAQDGRIRHNQLKHQQWQTLRSNPKYQKEFDEIKQLRTDLRAERHVLRALEQQGITDSNSDQAKAIKAQVRKIQSLEDKLNARRYALHDTYLKDQLSAQGN